MDNKKFIHDQINMMLAKKYYQPMTPQERIKGGASALPVIGDAISGYDAYQSAKKGDYLGAALNAIGMLPMIPALAGTIKNKNVSPLRLFHGTDKLFDVFDASKTKGGTPTKINGESYTNASYAFAQNKRVAEFFANKSRTPAGVLYPGSRLIEADVYLKNPLIVDMNNVPKQFKYYETSAIDTGAKITDIALMKEISLKRARAEGYDGVIFKNGFDFRPYEGDIVFAFDNNQIKQISK